MALMTDGEKLSMVKTILRLDETDTSEDARIAAYLSMAKQEVISWRYSYGAQEVSEVPADYEMVQIYGVVAGYSQSGAENQRLHTENGIAREFVHSDMIQYIRANVIPLCRVM